MHAVGDTPLEPRSTRSKGNLAAGRMGGSPAARLRDPDIERGPQQHIPDVLGIAPGPQKWVAGEVRRKVSGRGPRSTPRCYTLLGPLVLNGLKLWVNSWLHAQKSHGPLGSSSPLCLMAHIHPSA
jgi:hypothetical protein